MAVSNTYLSGVEWYGLNEEIYGFRAITFINPLDLLIGCDPDEAGRVERESHLINPGDI